MQMLKAVPVSTKLLLNIYYKDYKLQMYYNENPKKVIMESGA